MGDVRDLLQEEHQKQMLRMIPLFEEMSRELFEDVWERMITIDIEPGRCVCSAKQVSGR